MAELSQRRCVCGGSSTLPLCDGSHRSAGWRCDRGRPLVARAFVAGTHYANLAERLADRFGGVALHRVEGRLQAEELVILADASDLEILRAQLERVRWTRGRVLAIDLDAQVVAGVFPGLPWLRIQGSDPIRLWHSAVAACQARPKPGAVGGLPSLFISHAVRDEGRLLPAIEYLRRVLGAEVFLCGDSIPAGDCWQPTIMGRLRTAERVVFVLSAASVQSTFCAYEIGVVQTLGLPLGILGLDQTPPPAFIQHLQICQVERLGRMRPWLSPEQLLIEALVEAISIPGTAAD